ncbi:thioredoxin family protein [Halomonas alkalisoli]|uniref:thioredoxin family protein n=1 Tax=Halomonas alkalisoli TaxID=2907158 RepID=UPI001F21EF41|nr:thioredoxin family protein [Halomonas alkalisoli]MCE9682770.1 thioredoxin family protein [Halomonas alkalisoli]
MAKRRSKRQKPTASARKPHARAPRRFSPRRLVRGVLIALAILAVPVTWLILEERQARALADLSVVGNGEPVAVQVFDQGCPDCRRLRDNAEQALANIERPPAWRMVNINSSQGRRFAGEQMVDHVTIVLFDGRGERTDVIRGVASVSELETAFSDLGRNARARRER